MNRTQKRLATLCIVAAYAAVSAQAQNPSPTVDSLASDLAALTARVAKLEGQIQADDLVGTYVLSGIQVELHGGSNSASVSSYVFTGTLVLAADGTATLNGSQTGNTLSIGTSSSLSPFRGGGGGGAITTTWSYADGTLTFLGTRLAVTAGGRILIASTANNSDGTNVLLILTRLQLDPTASSSAVWPGSSTRRE